jgi:hypothetical protein
MFRMSNVIDRCAGADNQAARWTRCDSPDNARVDPGPEGSNATTTHQCLGSARITVISPASINHFVFSAVPCLIEDQQARLKRFNECALFARLADPQCLIWLGGTLHGAEFGD